MARPKIDFHLTDEKTHKMFKEMCSLQCTQSEIAGVFGVSVDTLSSRIKDTFECSFPEIFKEYSADGKMSLRRCQFRLAQKSAAMAIFLGKNYLEQVDVKTLDDVNKPITLTWADAKVKSDTVTVKVGPEKAQ